MILFHVNTNSTMRTCTLGGSSPKPPWIWDADPVLRKATVPLLSGPHRPPWPCPAHGNLVPDLLLEVQALLTVKVQRTLLRQTGNVSVEWLFPHSKQAVYHLGLSSGFMMYSFHKASSPVSVVLCSKRQNCRGNP